MSILVRTISECFGYGYYYFHDTTIESDTHNYKKRIFDGKTITNIICDDRNLFVKGVKHINSNHLGAKIEKRFI